ncbi:MAG: hypothetical protein HY747_11010, partial [Elusimicrobia bacterium]|nr:hypothetical protein [Elusimicrobiota bacterium]
LAKIRPWVLGLAAGAAALIRLEGMIAVGLCLLWDLRGGRRGGRWAQPVKALVVCFILTAPYLVMQKINYGRFFSSHRGHAAYWVERKSAVESGASFDSPGQAGGAPNAPAGNAGSWGKFFVSEGLPRMILRWAKGYVLGFVWYLPRIWQGALWAIPLMAAGFVFLIKCRDWRMGIFLLAVLFPVAYILPLDQIRPGSGVELRFVLPLVWPTAFLAGIGFDGIRTWLYRLFLGK